MTHSATVSRASSWTLRFHAFRKGSSKAQAHKAIPRKKRTSHKQKTAPTMREPDRAKKVRNNRANPRTDAPRDIPHSIHSILSSRQTIYGFCSKMDRLRTYAERHGMTIWQLPSGHGEGQKKLRRSFASPPLHLRSLGRRKSGWKTTLQKGQNGLSLTK